jgi:hypothetical protein
MSPTGSNPIGVRASATNDRRSSAPAVRNVTDAGDVSPCSDTGPSPQASRRSFASSFPLSDGSIERCDVPRRKKLAPCAVRPLVALI